jgi:hypothetical protein
MHRIYRNALNLMTMVFMIVTLSLYLLPSLAAASSRVLVVHNNTDATITVISTDRISGAERVEEVPPNTKKSLYNFLFYGRNEVYFDASRVSPRPQPIVRIFVAEHSGVKPKHIELFPRDFGKSVMFDSGERSASQPPSLRRWVYESLGDPCEGYDDVLLEGSSNPEPTRCNASTLGMVAVCWDGKNVINRYKAGAFCTYKKRDCETKGKKGVSPGRIYRCQ